MNETLKEQISAFVDGELPDNESELLVRRLSQDAELRELAARYFTVGRAVRSESIVSAENDLRSRVAAELGTEQPERLPVDAPNSGRYLRPLAGVAVAASVAVIALFSLQRVGPAPTPIATVANNDLAAIAIDEAPLYTEPPVSEFRNDRPSAMLTRYYQQHNERAADIGGSGILTRLVELELRGGELVRTAGDIANGGTARPAETENVDNDQADPAASDEQL